MAEGTSTYKGLAVPLNGEAEIQQINAATDVLTLTRKSGGTGDMVVIQDADGTERFVVRPKGYLGLTPNILTTAPTTGLVKGDLLVVWSGDFPSLGICISTATKAIRYAPAFAGVTAGRTSVT